MHYCYAHRQHNAYPSTTLTSNAPCRRALRPLILMAVVPIPVPLPHPAAAQPLPVADVPVVVLPQVGAAYQCVRGLRLQECTQRGSRIFTPTFFLLSLYSSFHVFHSTFADTCRHRAKSSGKIETYTSISALALHQLQCGGHYSSVAMFLSV